MTVYHASGTEIFTWSSGHSGQTHGGVKVDFITSGPFAGTVEIFGIHDDYSIAYEAASHERVKVTGLSGKFDIGGFNIFEAQPTPDQKFEFTVGIIDYDGDIASDTFDVFVDGTGIFDNDAFDLLV